MACVDHEPRRKPGLGEQLARRRDVLGAVVRRLAAAQNDTPVGIAGRRRDGRLTLLGHGQEMMRMRRRADGVYGNLDVAVGAVLEADGAREARRELAVDLALGRARADRAPGDEIGDVLRRDRIEVLDAGRQAERVDVAQEAASWAESL